MGRVGPTFPKGHTVTIRPVLERSTTERGSPPHRLRNFWVADHFTRQHLNPFFAYLKRSLDRFSPATTFNSVLGEPQYRWEQDGRTLVQFSFVERRS
jgi:hypothetical protein